MVETELTQKLIDEGAELIRKLDNEGARPEAAFWIYIPEITAWKLLVAETKTSKEGPKEFYRLIQKVLSKSPKGSRSLSLEDIGLAKTDSTLVSLLSSAIRTGPEISGIRFSHNVINGTLIEDAYIYRLMKSTKSAPRKST